jgi:hypothetical protein
MSDTIIIHIARTFVHSQYKPYYTFCKTHLIKREHSYFSTLRDVIDYYNIKVGNLTRLTGKEWAIGNSGKKYEWYEYEAKISIDYAIKETKWK